LLWVQRQAEAAMSKAYAVNTRVEWDWGQGTGKGKVREVHKEKVTKTIKGSEITRNGDADDPAYLIEQADGDQVLKTHSELRKTS
jgi:hypothetical protein